MIVPIILSGGMGTRLWPFSRDLEPKQLAAFGGDQTLLQDTVARLEGLADCAAPIIVCNETHRFIVAEQLRVLGVERTQIFLEPMGRNTAPAIAVGALAALELHEDAAILVMPADHRIGELALFHEAVKRGVSRVEQGQLVAFGIPPRHPETGYGYIRCGRELSEECFHIAQFVEKPSLSLAEQYVASGDYFWNSGMFLFGARAYLEALEAFQPEMLVWSRRAYAQRTTTGPFEHLDAAAFEQCPSDSVDYAVMEHTESAAMVSLASPWSDLGSWSAVWEDGPKDEHGNSTHGEGRFVECKNSMIHASDRLVTAVGVEQVAIVETADAVLVVGMEKDQYVKELVQGLRAGGREEVHAHMTVRRPWGSYTRLGEQEGFQVKRIVVTPGSSLSLQKHFRRAEHWVVVRGVARITNGDEVFERRAHEHTFIPMGTIHRLENPGDEDLEIIEVQLGDYFGEDDIVRLQDVYGRS